MSSSPQMYTVNSKNSGLKKDLTFWGGTETKKCEHDGDCESSPIEFQTQRGDYSAYSPTLWASTSHMNSNLLPDNHLYSSPSPTSRLQVIQDRRKELMEMVQGLPESSYELSLQDIVDYGKVKQEVQQEMEKKIDRKNVKNNVKRQMSRSQSMNNDVFLLKMFVPSCLSCKKKTALGNHKKVSRMPSFDGYEKPMDNDRWSLSYLAFRKNRSSSSGSSSSRTTGCDSDNRTRNVDGNFTPGSSTSENLCKSRGHRGCLF